jgi:hypothetical protein
LKLQTSATTQGKVPTATEISNANQTDDTTLTLHDVAKTGSYADLLNKPTIPTVGSGTLTIQKEGTAVGTFGANQSSAATVNIVETDPTVPAWAKADAKPTYTYAEIDGKPTFKTVGGTAITGTGDIALPAVGSGALKLQTSATTQGKVPTATEISNANQTDDTTLMLHDVAKTGSYADLLNKPTIPTVNNPAINIRKNGVTAGSFTLNQATPASQNIDLTFGTMADAAASDYRTASAQDTIDGAHLTKDDIIAGANVSVSKNGNSCTIAVTGIQVPDVYYAFDTITGGVGETVTGLSQANLEIIYATGTVTAEVGDTVYFDGGAGVVSAVAGDEATGTYDLVIVSRQVSAIFETIGGNASDNSSLVNYVSGQLSSNIIGWAFKNNQDVPTVASADDALKNGLYIVVSSGLLLTAKQGAVIRQVLFTYDSGVIKVRYSSDSGATFNAWMTVDTANDSAVTVTTATKGDIDSFTLNQSADKTVTLADVAKTGSYADLLNKPTIPTVGSGTLTIQKEGTAVGTFGANQSTAATVNIVETDPTVPAWAKADAKPTYTYAEIDGKPTFKTVGGTAITGTGDIALPAVGSGALKLQTSATTQGKVPTATEISNANQTDDTTLTLHDVAKTGSYADLLNKPTIPTVGSGTLTIQKEGTSVGTFGANQSSAATVNIVETDPTVPAWAKADAKPTYTYAEIDGKPTFKTVGGTAITGTGDIALPVVGSGALKLQTSATTQGKVPTATEISNANQTDDTTLTLHDVARTGSYADLLNKPTIPTNTNQLTNGAGFVGASAIKDSVVTIQKNGVTAGSFTLNQDTDKVINIEVPTKTSDLSNDSGFATTSQIPTVGNGALKIISSTTSQTAPTAAVNLGTANQTGTTTTTLHKAAWTGTYGDLNGTPTFKTVGGTSIVGSGDVPFPTVPTVNDSTLTLTAGTTTQTFKQNTGGNKSFTVPAASGSTDGLLSTTNYTKLSGIASNADVTPPLIKKICCVSGTANQVKITATKACSLAGFVYSTGA